uniref:NRDE family protein n=1 Tax=Flavobacterium sp. TaxID=239 RepID=UPI00404B92B7
MCTVSFVSTANGFCITSNRDEKTARQKAIPPTKYNINNKEIYFPKDPQAGGTWFAHDNKNVIVLLNGAKEKHISAGNYKKSRGLIVLDLISSNNPLAEWQTIDLNNIEPFTIVFFNCEKLFQLQWNAIEKSTIELDKSKKHIWSSSTLYAKEIRAERAKWFAEFSTKNLDPKDLLHFHQFTKNNNLEYGLQINRNNLLKTVSITQCVITETISLNYIDLLD